jgi:hypothetical protein
VSEDKGPDCTQESNAADEAKPADDAKPAGQVKAKTARVRRSPSFMRRVDRFLNR